MKRRQFLTGAGGTMAIAVAGCNGSGGSNETYAEAAVDVVDDELGVLDWDVDEDRYYLEFATSGNPGHDIQVVGGSYAGAVGNGLDVPLMGVAVGEETDETAYWVDVEVEWAEQYFVDEEISEDEYLDLIEGTIE